MHAGKMIIFKGKKEVNFDHTVFNNENILKKYIQLD